MQAPDNAIPKPKANAAIANTQLVGPMCAPGGKYSPDVSGKYIPKTIA